MTALQYLSEDFFCKSRLASYTAVCSLLSHTKCKKNLHVAWTGCESTIAFLALGYDGSFKLHMACKIIEIVLTHCSFLIKHVSCALGPFLISEMHRQPGSLSGTLQKSH